MPSSANLNAPSSSRQGTVVAVSLAGSLTGAGFSGFFGLARCCQFSPPCSSNATCSKPFSITDEGSLTIWLFKSNPAPASWKLRSVNNGSGAASGPVSAILISPTVSLIPWAMTCGLSAPTSAVAAKSSPRLPRVAAKGIWLLASA